MNISTENTQQLSMNEVDIDEENEYIKDLACLEADREWWSDIDEDLNYG